MCLAISQFFYLPDTVVEYVVDDAGSSGSGGGGGGCDDGVCVCGGFSVRWWW